MDDIHVTGGELVASSVNIEVSYVDEHSESDE
jgi:hypothetical protein